MSEQKIASEQPEDEAGALLLDKEWERQQEKTFTAWTNSHLRKLGLQIENISDDLRSGKKLMTLLEVISGEHLPKAEKGNLRLHHVNNVNCALKFISQKGVKLAGIGAEEIVDGNYKMTLGMIWTIILRFAISVVGAGKGLSAKDGLLVWVKKKTAGYRGVNVTNFTTSFRDGLALCALIHAHRPDLLDYSQLSKDDPAHNLKLAFDVAENHLDIPKMLDVEDMLLPIPDEKSVMTYVSCFYHAFSSSQQMENAARRVMKVVDTNKENQKRIDEYEKLATDLLDWIAKMVPELDNRGDDDPSVEYIRDRLKGVSGYKRSEKPPRVDQKTKLESSFNTLRTKLHLLNRPEYVAADGLTLKDLNGKWKTLETSEKSLIDWLNMMLKKLEQLEHLDKKFRYKCDQQDLWYKGKDEFLTGNVNTFSLSEITAYKKRFSALENDINSRGSRIKVITSLKQKLQELHYSRMSEIEARHNQVISDWDRLNQLKDGYKSKLDAQFQLVQKLDDLYSTYAVKAPIFKGFLEDSVEDVNDTFIAHTVKDAEELQTQHQEFTNLVKSEDGKIQELLDIVQQARAICPDPNPYSSISSESLEETWKVLQAGLVERTELLEQERQKQVINEKLLQEFAAKANEIDEWQNTTFQKLQDVILNKEDKNLESQSQTLTALGHDIETYYKDKLSEIDTLNKRLHEDRIYFNPYTTHTTETISGGYQRLMSTMSSSLNEIENQILVRDSGNLTEQQVTELKKSFNHFDRQKLGYLQLDEFRSFLVSQGSNVSTDDTTGDKEFDRIKSRCDPENTAQITFNNYLNYLVTENKDTDTAEQVIDSLAILAGGLEYITIEIINREFPKEYSQHIIANMQPSTVADAPAGALDYRSFAGTLYGESDL